MRSDQERVPSPQNHLTLRSTAERCVSKGGTQSWCCRPFETGASRPPQGEVGLRSDGRGTYRIICRNAAGRRRESLHAPRTSLRMHTRISEQTLAPCDDSPAAICPKSRSGLFALRRGAAKAGHAGRDTIACIAVGDASIAVTSSHVSLIEHAGPPRATPMT